MTTPTTPTRPRRPEPPTKLSKSDATAEHPTDATEIDSPDASPTADELDAAPPVDDDFADASPSAAIEDVDEEQLSWIEGDAVEVTPGADPFTSTLALINETDQMAVWVRLTPTAIAAIVDQLDNVLALQHAALGMPHHPVGTPNTDEDGDGDEVDETVAGDENEEDQADSREGVLQRARDPLGLRFIASRSNRAVWYIAGAVLLLVVVAAVLSRVNL